MEYEPVCSEDDFGNEVQYPNQCAFENYNCRHKNEGALSGRNCHWWSKLMFFATTFQNTPYCMLVNVVTVTLYVLIFINPYVPETVRGMWKHGTMNANWKKTIANILIVVSSIIWNAFQSVSDKVSFFLGTACTVINEGECKAECSDICPALYKPVCASSNGDCSCSGARTFSNECLLNSYNCHNPTKGKYQIITAKANQPSQA